VCGHGALVCRGFRDVPFAKSPLGKRGYDVNSVNDLLVQAIRRLARSCVLSAVEVA